jgi:hypothetical protein
MHEENSNGEKKDVRKMIEKSLERLDMEIREPNPS